MKYFGRIILIVWHLFHDLNTPFIANAIDINREKWTKWNNLCLH